MNRQKSSLRTLISFITCLYLSAVSCGRHPELNTTKTHDSTDIVQIKQSELSDSGSSRALLIQELKRLRGILSSNDKNQVRLIFHFPVSDSVLAFVTSLDDASFRREYEKNRGLTAHMFENNYRRIYEDWRLNEFNKLFTYLPLDSLLQKDTLRYELIVKNEPCLKQYLLIIKDSIVRITYGSNNNRGYSGKKSDDDIGDECEYDTYWEFIFDGKSLVFEREVFAG